MVMQTKSPQGARLNPQNVLELSQGMSIQVAIDTANAHGGEWTILLYTGVYREGDITHVGVANITIKGMGLDRTVIAPVGAPATGVIVSGAIMTLEGVGVINPDLTMPALRVTGGTCNCVRCTFDQVGGAGGNVIEMVNGELTLHDCETDVGAIDLTDAACTLTLAGCNVGGPVNTSDGTGANVVMTVTLRHCDCNDQVMGLAATGACVYELESCNHIGTITDASLGAGAVNGHMCRCHVVVGGLVKNGTTGWLINNSELTNISNADATGVISVYGGIFLACGNATGVTLWYKAPSLMWVLPSGATDHINIQAALDALPVTGGEVFLLEGTYYVEVSIVLDSYQTLRGCGRNTILTTSTPTLDIVTATCGDGTELVGILIADLCIDGFAGGVASGDGIDWFFVDYSKIINVWLRRLGGNTIWGCIGLEDCDFNEILANTLEDNDPEGIQLIRSTFNIILGNICLRGDDYGITLWAGSDNNTVVGNVLQGNIAGIVPRTHGNTISGNVCRENVECGIYGYGGSDTVVSGNICWRNGQHGIELEAGANVVISGNMCQENVLDGIYIPNINSAVVSGNICRKNGQDGIHLLSGHSHIMSGNTCTENSQATDNLYDNIYLHSTDYNLITNNLCRASTIGTTLTVGEPIGETEIAVTAAAGFEVGMGVVIDLGGVNEEYHRIVGIAGNVITIDVGLTNAQGAGETIDVPEARYGINIFNAACLENTVKHNKLYDSGKTAAFNDAGTDTHLAAYVVPFSHGSDPQDSGFEIDVAAEFALAWLRLPIEVQQIVRMKIYARSVVLEADAMRLEINVNGGADNEAFNTHATAAPNTPSTSTNFAADDIIFWTLVAAEILALVGGDSVEVKVLHEVAGNGDCETDAFLRTVEFEYV